MPERTTKQEIIKQIIDQTAHFFWAFASVFPGAYALATDQDLIPTIALIVLGEVSLAAVVAREVYQWPSSRWWDPYLDWSFFIFGGLTGIYIGFIWTN